MHYVEFICGQKSYVNFHLILDLMLFRDLVSESNSSRLLYFVNLLVYLLFICFRVAKYTDSKRNHLDKGMCNNLLTAY